MNNYVLLFPAELWEFIDKSGWGWGLLNLRVDHGERVATISHIWNGNEKPAAVDTTTWQQGHYLRYADITARSAVWYLCDPSLHEIHYAVASRQDAALPVDYFREYIKNGWIEPGADPLPVVTVSTPQSGEPGVSAWRGTSDDVVPDAVSIVAETLKPADFIAREWPVDELGTCKVAVIGVGSIGSVLAEVLAIAGVGELGLVDHDRIEQRNLARHRLSARDLGRFKVNAMRDHIGRLNVATRVTPYPINVIDEADVLRQLVADVDVVVCAADGVAARRVANHVARRAGTPLVLAAVLEDGAFGELIRVRPQTGCLFCLRLDQIERGAFDPEPGIDLGYGTGTPHRPMTAAPSDLQLVASFAAKATLSTLLEARGRWNQRLPGDFAIIGLQPKPDMAAPFDIEHAGEVRWYNLPARRDDCPTCAPA